MDSYGSSLLFRKRKAMRDRMNTSGQYKHGRCYLCLYWRHLSLRREFLFYCWIPYPEDGRKKYRIRSPGGSAVLGSVIYFAAAGNFVYREHLAQRKIAEVCRIFLKESETKSLPLLRKNCNQGLQLEPQKLCNRTKAWFFVQILFTNSSLCDTITS